MINKKRCSKCRKTRLMTQFGLDERRKDGRKSWCQQCHVNGTMASYRRNNGRYVERARQSRKVIRAVLDKAKKKPCTDCGNSYPPYVMDFDHRPGNRKSFGLANAVNSHKALLEIQEEIAKCDVVCANCHRERTHQRGVAKR